MQSRSRRTGASAELAVPGRLIPDWWNGAKGIVRAGAVPAIEFV
jgi:hypothetical protein